MESKEGEVSWDDEVTVIAQMWSMVGGKMYIKATLQGLDECSTNVEWIEEGKRKRDPKWTQRERS